MWEWVRETELNIIIQMWFLIKVDKKKKAQQAHSQNTDSDIRDAQK